ncbi:hypothetical protein MAR_003721 [Mya arenaria]|uniref:Uncharacterized protein n=1 Tax=Mya arenaria TaxID=6604 RepID=A0ABY7G6V1_MYAAR|nr:hypothetical protein MAR_003721 [Mya arenaria]
MDGCVFLIELNNLLFQMMLILTKPAAIVPLINLFMTIPMIYMRFHLQSLAVLLDRPIQLQRDLPY